MSGGPSPSTSTSPPSLAPRLSAVFSRAGYPSALPVNPVFGSPSLAAAGPAASAVEGRGGVSAPSGSGAVSSTSSSQPHSGSLGRPDAGTTADLTHTTVPSYRTETMQMGFGEVQRVGSRSGGVGQEGSVDRAHSASSTRPPTTASGSGRSIHAASAGPSNLSQSTSSTAARPTRHPDGRTTSSTVHPPASSSSRNPPSSSRPPPPPAAGPSSTFIIAPPKVFEQTPAASVDVPMSRSPSPSPQRPETSTVLVHDSSDRDADGEPEDDDGDEDDWSDVEPAGVPTEDEIERLAAKVDEVTLDFGLADEDEVGDDESTEMEGLRELKSMIAPLLPALRSIPTLHAQVQSQSRTIASLRKVHKIQAGLAQKGAEELRSIKDVERGGWESSLRVILAKVHEAHKAEMAAQKAKLESTNTKAWSAGPTGSRKETGFETIESVDNAEYDKLIKKWMDVQADNRKLGMRETSMKMKIRDQESLVNALTEELHFLRASALHGLREAPSASPSHPNRALPSSRPIEDPLPAPAQRQTLGDARSEHLLLAAKRLRSLRISNPEIGLIRTRDYGQAGIVVPDEARAMEDLLNGRRPSVPLAAPVASGSTVPAGLPSRSDLRGVDASEEDEMTPKKRVRAKPKKALSVSTHHTGPLPSNAASIPIPRTPTSVAKGKKKAGGPPDPAEMTPGGTVVPSSFDDLLMAAGVYDRPHPQIGVSATRGGASAEGEDEMDEIESDSDPSAVMDSPKRRRMDSGAHWISGQPLTSGNLGRPPQDQPHPGGPMSANGPPPKTPLNTSTGSGKGEMHSSALNLLALASFGSPVRPSDATPTSHSRPEGLVGPHPHAGGLEPAFQLHSSPMPHSSPIPSGQSPAPPPDLPYTPYRHPQPPLAVEDLFSPAPSASSSSAVDRVKHQDPLRPSPVLSGGDVPSSPAGPQKPFVNLSSANITSNGAAAPGAADPAAPNMPAKRVRSPYLKWSNDEDELLARGVARYGQKWDLVSKAVPTRSYHQCRQRWLRKLGMFDHKPQIDGSSPGASSTPFVTSPKKERLATAASIFGGHGPGAE